MSGKKQRIFLDTSVIIRFLTADDVEKFKDCKALFELIEQGSFVPYIANMVIVESIFVLSKLYKFPKNRVVNAMRSLLSLRNCTIVEKTDSETAIGLFASKNVSFGDCMIASQVPVGVQLVTYDTDFSHLGISSVTPSKLLSN
ncbi:PIN domain-containing protein [Patescibacteria group bacterium]|nr:PIN domain-containing protein [Patescibacteria group bacterium]